MRVGVGGDAREWVNGELWRSDTVIVIVIVTVVIAGGGNCRCSDGE